MRVEILLCLSLLGAFVDQSQFFLNVVRYDDAQLSILFFYDARNFNSFS